MKRFLSAIVFSCACGAAYSQDASYPPVAPPLHSTIGPFSLYWKNDDDNFIFKRRNDIMYRKETANGVASDIMQEGPFIIFSQKRTLGGKLLESDKYVFGENNIISGVYRDTDGDGLFDLYIDFITKKKYSINFIEISGGIKRSKD